MAAARGSYRTRSRVTAKMNSVEAEQVSRSARFALRDAEYRIRLGLAPGEPLPRVLGHTAGHARPGAFLLDAVGGRHSIPPERDVETSRRAAELVT